jgi:hypothetical protein
MKASKGFPPSEYRDVLAELELREPSSPHEAAIFIKSIREKKGYIDEDVREDLQNLLECNRITIEDALKRGRDSEAAFTRRFDQRNNLVTKF